MPTQQPLAPQVGTELCAHSPRPPLHRHPYQAERFTVLSGRLHAVVAGVEQHLLPGNVLDVPRAADHQMWGAADEPTIVLWRTTPALRTDQMFCDLWSAAAEHGFQLPPLRAYELSLRYPEEFELV